MRFKLRSLVWKVAIAFGILGIILLIIANLVTFRYARSTINIEVSRRLLTIHALKKQAVVTFLESCMLEMGLISKSRYPIDLLNYMAFKKHGSLATSEVIYGILAKQAHAFLTSKEMLRKFADFVILDFNNFDVLYLASAGIKESLRATEELKDLKKVWEKIKEAKDRIVISDIVKYAPLNRPCLLMGTTIRDNRNQTLGVLIGVVNPDSFEDVVNRSIASSEVETYIVGTDGLFRTRMRHDEFGVVFSRKINSEILKKALSSEQGFTVSKGYRGKEVLSVYGRLDLPNLFNAGFDWILVSEIPKSRALGSIGGLTHEYLLVVVILSLLQGFAGYVMARTLVLPLGKLNDVANELAEGNLAVSIPDIKRTDEFGELVENFSRMKETMYENISEIIEAAQRLSTAISHISEASAQLAANSAETTASIGEVAAAVEEVRQTAKLSHEKAEKVAEDSKKAVQSVDKGLEITNSAIEGLNKIRKEMDFVAQSIMRLSEHNQDIGNIIDVVMDLADQVNILSVNAAIEAAKAGEQGKGFAVVAQEMRNLAERSKEGAERIKQILSQIQNATAESVMAIERGMKAANAGQDLGQQVGATIRHLAEVIEEASDAALQIVASSHEQVTGVEQITAAMQSIREASQNNAESAKQMEESIQDLSSLSQMLQELAAHYRL
ncbi:MAG: methyl-accepting chemotaxis protein [Deltaproteobacteria bacterium]|nr:methyl-accepting chemotaxis protein [Deltaproteobacteria bacterium]